MALLEAHEVRVHFPVNRGLLRAGQMLRAVDGVSLNLEAGETLGIVGESGCGKSTLARAIMGLQPLTGGTVRFDGQSLATLPRADMRRLRAKMQLVFQDPLAALNPRMTIQECVAEPLWTHALSLDAAEVTRQVTAMLERVGLGANQLGRYPHELSGGQCQRVGIARALVLRPQLLVCDEPVSALDVSVRAQIINLLADLQQEMGMAMVFIAHDLAMVRQLSRRVMVMYLGQVVEEADSEELFAQPSHPYTQALINAVPPSDPVASDEPYPVLSGDPPSPLGPPVGCAFYGRCPIARPDCAERQPPLRLLQTRGRKHWVACSYAE